MDTVTLCRLACSDTLLRKKFGGVFASDRLPRSKRNYSSFIVNLDPHTLPGSHWIAIDFHKKEAYYFDSYGQSPSEKNILNFMKRNADNIVYNENCFQDDLTTTCGYFCLYFLFRRARSLNLNHLSKKNKKQNETFIKMFIRQHFKYRRCCLFSTNTNKKQKCVAWINTRRASISHQ